MTSQTTNTWWVDWVLSGFAGTIEMALDVDGEPLAKVTTMFGLYRRMYRVVIVDGVHQRWVDTQTQIPADDSLQKELAYTWLLTVLKRPL